MSNPYILNVENVSKSVKSGDETLVILSTLNFSIKEGETIAIVGPSGSGKSTLLGLLAGLDLPTSGHIKLYQHTLSQLDEDQRALLRAQYIGFVFQAFHLLPSLTALENVMLPLELKGINNPRKQAYELLERVGLAQRIKHYPRQLSGGEQQRVAIARAFIAQPQLLLADEITGNLDQQTGLKIMDLLFALNIEHKTTLVLVTHDERLAERCQRRLTLKDGMLVV